jgi:hypothetical protein
LTPSLKDLKIKKGLFIIWNPTLEVKDKKAGRLSPGEGIPRCKLSFASPILATVPLVLEIEGFQVWEKMMKKSWVGEGMGGKGGWERWGGRKLGKGVFLPGCDWELTSSKKMVIFKVVVF